MKPFKTPTITTFDLIKALSKKDQNKALQNLVTIALYKGANAKRQIAAVKATEILCNLAQRH